MENKEVEVKEEVKEEEIVFHDSTRQVEETKDKKTNKLAITGFSLMYGSLTTIVLAMMWVYGCMYSILLGATINKMISEKCRKKKMKK